MSSGWLEREWHPDVGVMPPGQLVGRLGGIEIGFGGAAGVGGHHRVERGLHLSGLNEGETVALGKLADPLAIEAVERVKDDVLTLLGRPGKEAAKGSPTGNDETPPDDKTRQMA